VTRESFGIHVTSVEWARPSRRIPEAARADPRGTAPMMAPSDIDSGIPRDEDAIAESIGDAHEDGIDPPDIRNRTWPAIA